MAHQSEPFSFIQFRKPFVLWPIIAAGLVLSFLNWMAPNTVTPRVMGAIWLPIVLFVIMAVAEDFHIGNAVLIFLFASAITLGVAVVSLLYHIPFLTWFLDFIKVREFSVGRDTLLGFSLAFTVILLCYLIDIYFRRRWIVIQGMIFRKVFLHRADETVITPPYSVTYELPDLMDGSIMWFLGFRGLGGDLIIKKEGEEVLRIHMVVGAKELAERIQPFQSLPTEEQDRSTRIAPAPASHH